MNLPEKLAREIARVTTVRGHYVAVKDMPGVNVSFALAMIDAALERAKLAAGLEDPVAQIRAVVDLEAIKD